MSDMNNGGKPAFPIDTGAARAWATFENARKPLTDSMYVALVDELQAGMTQRELAAIKLRVPESGTEWLDNMIRASLRDEFAATVMQAGMHGASLPGLTDGNPGAVALLNEACATFYFVADAMLKARDQK